MSKSSTEFMKRWVLPGSIACNCLLLAFLAQGKGTKSTEPSEPDANGRSVPSHPVSLPPLGLAPNPPASNVESAPLPIGFVTLNRDEIRRHGRAFDYQLKLDETTGTTLNLTAPETQAVSQLGDATNERLQQLERNHLTKRRPTEGIKFGYLLEVPEDEMNAVCEEFRAGLCRILGEERGHVLGALAMWEPNVLSEGYDSYNFEFYWEGEFLQCSGVQARRNGGGGKLGLFWGARFGGGPMTHRFDHLFDFEAIRKQLPR